MSASSWPVLRGRPLVVETPDGVRLHGQVHGAEQPEATVVLLHGYQLSQRLWARQVQALCAGRPGLAVVTYDHRGHGSSGRGTPERSTLGQLARDLSTVLGALGDAPAVLVGHSMGGMTIMSLAEQLPGLVGDRVVGVGLLATSCGALAQNTYGLHPALARLAHTGVPRYNSWVQRRVERGRRKPPSPGTRWLLFGDRPDPLDVRRTQEVLVASDPAANAEFYVTLGEHERAHALAPLAGVPVLVVSGDKDRLTPLSHGCAIAEALPHARFVVQPGCGHMVQLERANQVNELLLELVDRALRSPRTAARRAG